MHYARNRTGSAVSIPCVRRAAFVRLLFAVCCTSAVGCTSALPGAKTAARVEPDVADEFAFVVSPDADKPSHGGAAPQTDEAAPVEAIRVVDSAPPTLRGSARATMVATPLDYAALPQMTDAPTPTRGFTLGKRRVLPTCAAGERPVEHDEWSLQGLSTSTVLRVDGILLPPVSQLASGKFIDGNDELDRLSEPRLHSADWTTVAAIAGTKRAVSLVEGRFDPATLSASPLRATKVDAVPIVPGEVWAFRRCAEGCHLPSGDRGRIEELTIVGPTAAWVGSAGPAEEAHLDVEQPFTVLSTRVAPGGSSSLLLDYRVSPPAPREADSPEPEPNTASVMIDVVWQSTDDTPTLTLYRGTYVSNVGPDYPPSRVGLGASVCDDDLRRTPYPPAVLLRD